jgi:hypothetical protein
MIRKWTVPCVVMCAMVSVLAGCSAGSPSVAKTATPDLHAAALQVAVCMRGEGFDMPDPTFGSDGTPVFNEDPASRGNAAYEQARAICRKPFNDAWIASGQPNTKAQSTQNLLAFAQCLRAHGVNVPDPGANGSWALSKELTNSPAWEAANKACGDTLRASASQQGSGR